MDDCAALQEVLLQWMSSSRTAREIDRELGDLHSDLLVSSPLLTYLRYNVDLCPENVRKLIPDISEQKIGALHETDAPENMRELYDLGKAEGLRGVLEDDFPKVLTLFSCKKDRQRR